MELRAKSQELRATDAEEKEREIEKDRTIDAEEREREKHR